MSFAINLAYSFYVLPTFSCTRSSVFFTSSKGWSPSSLIFLEVLEVVLRVRFIYGQYRLLRGDLARLGQEKGFQGFQLSDSGAKLDIGLDLGGGQASVEVDKEGFLLGS